LAASTDYAFSPQLAVSEDGRAIAAWFSGTPPQVEAGPARGRGVATAWKGSTVVVDRGTVAGGFGAPVVLSGHGTDESNELKVALSRAGVAYATWSETGTGRTMIAAASSDRAFSRPRALLPKNARLLGLLASHRGPVAAVWDTFGTGSSSAVLHYALLRADGSLGRAVTVGPWNGSTEGAPFALNDQGAFAAVGTDGHDGEGVQPPRPVVSVCDAAGHCSPARVLSLGRIPAGANEQNTVALSDDGTVTVLAGYSKNLEHPSGYSAPLGLWEAARRPDGRWQAVGELSPDGNFPVVATDGVHSALTVFQKEPGGVLGGLAWAQLPGTDTRSANPAMLSGPNSPYPPVLAANIASDFVIAWNDQPQGLVNAAESSVAATTGGQDHLSHTQLIAQGNVAAKTIQTGIDGTGEAIVVWSDFIGNHSQGVFAAVHRP
jgi:hypothetical protein